MATIIEPETTRVEKITHIERGDSSAGWAVAVVVLIAVVVVGGYFWMRSHRAAAPAQNSGTNINVTLPGGTNNTSPTPAPAQ